MKAFVFLAAVAAFASVEAANGVNVFIGSVEPGHVTPAAAAPFGMVQAGPDTSPTEDRYSPGKAHCGGYDYGDGWVWRFSQTHVSGTGCITFGDFGLLPYPDGFDGRNRPAKLLKETESAAPGRYSVTLGMGDEKLPVEIVALPRSAIYRIVYPKGKAAKLLVDLDWGLRDPSMDDCFGKRVFSSSCTFPAANSVQGGRRVKIWNEYENFFALEFSHSYIRRTQLRADDGLRGQIHELDFGPLEDGVLEIRLGLSFTSAEAAKKNLAAEVGRRMFGAAAVSSSALWRRALGRVTLDPATPEKTAASFRAALYRALYQPNLISDAGAPARYSTLSLWDTFRAAHPLYTLVAPERVADFVNSMLDQYDRQGYLPIWAVGGRDNHCMIGHHAVPVIVDAYLKGSRGLRGLDGVDWERAYAAIKDSLTRNHQAVGDGTWGLMKEDWDILDKYGYYPFDQMRGEYRGRPVKGESVSRVLECAYDDACAARLAKALGKTEDAVFFEKRSANWRNVFDPSTGFMRGKDSKGSWREPFNPWAMGTGPWRENDFCEGNSWQYSWHVMQDPEGLVAAMGGREKFVAKLESLFTACPLDAADGTSYDASGLIGQYAHGNEPSHHVIYFFTLAGRPDLAGKYVRKVFDTQYEPNPKGLCGNDDCGQMAAWYVFSALGFYPFDPCGGDYVVGAPQVAGATLQLPDDKELKITVKNFSAENQVVKSVVFTPASQPPAPGSQFVLKHADLMRGGEIVFTMGK